MLQSPDKYLYIPYSKYGGLDSASYDLELTINAALSMKRIPIIQKFTAVKKHRLDNLKKNSVINWDKYFNLSETKILAVSPDGTIKEISDALQYVHERDFNFNLYSKNQIRFIDKTQVSDKENDQYPIICLLPAKDFSKQAKSLIFSKRLSSNCRVDIYPNPSFFIDFQASQEVNNLTDMVLSHFGTDLDSMNTLSKVLYEIPEVRYTDRKFHYKDLNCYACMHVRYGGGSEQASAMLKSSSALTREIKKVLRVVYARNHKSLPLYIMSNIIDIDYFNFLKPIYNIYRYTDFKGLQERLSENQEIDHNLLFMVEKNIMKHAMVKILSWNRNRFFFECPWQSMRRIF